MVQRFISGLKVHPTTVRHIYGTIQSLWREAKAWNYVSHNISEGIRLPKGVRPSRRFFSMDEMRRIITKAEEPYKTCFWIAAETGLRCGEICGLRWDDVNLETSILTVQQAAWGGKLQGPKTTNSVRRFCVSRELSAYLKSYREKAKPNSLGLIFSTKNGTAWCAIKPLKYLKKTLAELEIAPAGMHALRHAQATIGLSEGVPLKTVQERLGHASALVTADVYGHAVSADDRNFATWLGGELSREAETTRPTPTNVFSFAKRKSA